MTSCRLTAADLKSGFFVFLIALPLCLGIAMASGFPPVAGLITAVIGGLVSSFFGSARLTIKGPAAGLIGVAISAVTELSNGSDMSTGYRRCLAVGVAAALLQILFAFKKWARLGALVPSAVVHGMLAAIGVIIFAKQFHVMMGVKPLGISPFQLMAEIPKSVVQANPRVALLGVITLSCLCVGHFLSWRPLNKVPMAIVALAIVMLLGTAWRLDTVHTYFFAGHAYALGSQFLVTLPGHFRDSIALPDFSALRNLVAWKYVLMFALIGSIESTLTVSAVDAMDPEQGVSDPDRDLFATGLGNLVSAMVGGLPMISEIVRSKANIDNGARSHWSNACHGFLLLLSTALFPDLLHHIPLAALGGMLLFTGLRLASPKDFLKAYKIGSDQLLLFVTTLLVTLKTDLLVGVASGIALKIALHIARGASPRQLLHLDAELDEDSAHILVRSPAVFTTFPKLQKLVVKAAQSAPSRTVHIDFSTAPLVDHTTQERLRALARTMPGMRIEVRGLDSLKRMSRHELATRRS